MQVLNDDDNEGLLGYGRMLNECCKTIRDGHEMAANMGLSPEDVSIEGAMTFTDDRDGKLYRVSIAEAEAEGDDN